jgi:hypothetical protein
VPTTYVLRAASSDLSAGGIGNKQLLVGTESAGSFSTGSIAAGATVEAFGFTAPAIPGAGGSSGSYTVELNVVTGATGLLYSCRVARVNAAGTVQAESVVSAEVNGSGGLKTWTVTTPLLGTWVAGDRLRVRYRVRNSGTHGSVTAALGTGTVDSQTIAPWTTVNTVTGQATGSFTFTGSASGTKTVTGQAAGSFTFTGSASGEIVVSTVTGQATGTYTFTGSVAGTRLVTGQAGGTYIFTGSAAGEVFIPTVTGQATGDFTFTGSASGVVTSFPGPPVGGTVHAVNADGLSKVVQVPVHAAGDLLLLVAGWDGNPTVTIPNVGGKAWTNLATNSNGSNSRLWTAYILNATGNGSTEDITLALTLSERGTARIYRIPGAHLTTLPAFANGFSNSADFDVAALDPSTWDIEDTLWLVVFAHDSGTVTVTAAPAGYIGLEDHQVGDAATGAGFALAYRNAAVASENPGPWTVTAENHAFATIAIRPDTGAPAPVEGQATGDFTFTGSAAGTKIVSGAISTTYDFTGSALGTRLVAGVVTGDYTFIGAASGVVTGGALVSGVATGTYAFTGSASGTRLVSGVATGTYAFTGSASGTRLVSGAAGGTYAFIGSASGVPTKLGAALGAFTFSGTAAGQPLRSGVATGTYIFTGDARGTIIGVVTGQALGTFTFTGAASGTRIVGGSISTAFIFAGAGVGTTTKVGQATGNYVFTGLAVGIDVTVGVATGTYVFTGMASGVATPSETPPIMRPASDYADADSKASADTADTGVRGGEWADVVSVRSWSH